MSVSRCETKRLLDPTRDVCVEIASDKRTWNNTIISVSYWRVSTLSATLMQAAAV